MKDLKEKRRIRIPATTAGDFSNVGVELIDGVPSLLSATPTETSIDLAWTNSSSNEDGILIERGLNGVDFAGLNVVANGVDSYSDETAEIDTDYYYRVTAFKGHSFSDASNVAQGSMLNPFANSIFQSGDFDFVNNLWLDESGNENNAALVQSNCGTVLISDKLIFKTNLAGIVGDWEVTNSGTAIGFVAASNQIQFSQAGTIYNVRVKNTVIGVEYFYPISTISKIVYDCSGNGNHLTYYYQSLALFSANKQNDFHYNLMKGGSTLTDELFTNSNLEGTFTSGLASGVLNTGTLSKTEENSIVHSGTKAQRFTANSGYGVYVNVDAIKGDTINFQAWVYVVSGGVDLSFDATYTNYRLYEASETSTIIGEWQLLQAHISVKNTGTVKCRILSTVSASTIIVDDISVKLKGEVIRIPALESGLTDAVGNAMDVLPQTTKYVETAVNMPTELSAFDKNSFFFTGETANNAKLNNLQLALSNLVTDNNIFYDENDKKLVVFEAPQNSTSVTRILNKWGKSLVRLFRDYRSDFIYDWANTINVHYVNQNYRVGVSKNRYIHWSDDNGQNWSAGYDYTAISTNVSLISITSKGSIIVFRNDNTIQRSSNGAVSFQTITPLGLDGNALVKHTPSNPLLPGIYYTPYKRICDVYDSSADTNIICWGSWGNKNDSNNPTYLFYSIDDGATIKAFYLFGQNPSYTDNGTLLGDSENSLIVRHIHEISHNIYDGSFYVSTGDNHVTDEIHILKFDYDSGLDEWSVPIDLLDNSTQRQRMVQLGFDADGYMYYGSDGDPSVITQNDIAYNVWGLYKCKIEDVSDLSKHIELFASNDVIVNYLYDNGTIAFSVTKQHDSLQDTNFYVSINKGATWMQADFTDYSYYIDPNQEYYNPVYPDLVLVDSDKNYLVKCGFGSFFMNVVN